MFDYQLKLSKRRKTVAIKVTPKQVLVTAPYNICEVALENWLKGKTETQFSSLFFHAFIKKLNKWFYIATNCINTDQINVLLTAKYIK